MTPYVGEIIMLPYYRGAPSGYLVCDGSLLQIADYEVLFNLIGTTYGGNGTTTFGVPDLRGRAPVHQGTGQGLTSYQLGQPFGTESVTLTTPQLPAHSHPLSASSAVASSASPVGALPAVLAQGLGYADPGAAAGANARPALATIGGSQPHENRSPSLAVVFAIAWDGVYPPRND